MEARQRGGHVLINGLGLGYVATKILEHDNVKHVTIIEKSEDVIKLIGPTLQKSFPGRVTIINEDAFEHKPKRGERYTVVWHDIWDDICTDNLSGMTKLHRKYGRRTEWQGSWQKENLEYQRERGQW